MSAYPKLTGLIAAAFTPFTKDGNLNLKLVERQAAHYEQEGLTGVFVGGTTGESHSLTVEERLQLARRWSEVARGTKLKWIVHVGHHSLPEAQTLAAQAEKLGADGISALAPSYFKPATVEDLVEVCAEVARSAPSLPFYYYDIPGLTGLTLSMPEFLNLGAKRIPTLAGLKFTNPDFITLQRCLAQAGNDLDIVYGNDECLVAAWAFGLRGAVGSTYNLIPSVAQRIFGHLKEGRWEEARAEQWRVVEFVQICGRYGYLPAAKASMSFLGLDCGPVRLPLRNLTEDERTRLREELSCLKQA